MACKTLYTTGNAFLVCSMKLIRRTTQYAVTFIFILIYRAVDCAVFGWGCNRI